MWGARQADQEPLLFYHRQVGSRLETGKRHALSSYKRMRTAILASIEGVHFFERSGKAITTAGHILLCSTSPAPTNTTPSYPMR